MKTFKFIFFFFQIASLTNMISSFRLTHGLFRRVSSRHAASVATPTIVPPVSILAGFLGAGKTSTLTHILQNREGLKVGVIVNDVASVNVDARVVKRLLSDDQSSLDMIELENGCVCCGPEAGQLAPAVMSLAQRGQERGAPFDHIVIELSGVADPAMVRHLLEVGGVDVEKVITLVDADAFPTLYHSADVMKSRLDLGGGKEAAEADPCVGMKKVVELLISQIEEADMIVANKADLASSASMKTTMFLCEALNTEATLKQSKLGQLPLSQLLPYNTTDVSTTSSHTHEHEHEHEHTHEHGDDNGEECHKHECNDPTHDHSHSHSHTFAAESLGISNFVYRAQRPFSEHRLMSQVIDTWPLPQKDILSLSDYAKPAGESSLFSTVLRSKGWVHLDKYPKQSIYWTHAGRHLGLEMKPASEGEEEEEEEVLSSQELVFIGMGMDEEKISEALDQCLLTDDEMTKFNERLESNSLMPSSELVAPRFAVGTPIEAKTGPDSWVKGTVVDIHYREPTWPIYKTAPYQIELADGQLIYAPADIDDVVRAV